MLDRGREGVDLVMQSMHAPPPHPKTNSNGCVGIGVIGVNEGGKVVIINVGGQRHEALKKNFDKFPQGTHGPTDRH